MQIPDEKAHQSTLAKTLTTWGLGLGSVLVANGISMFLVSSFVDAPGSDIIPLKWEMLEATEPVSLLLLGDSSCNQGVDPAALVPSGSEALNLCTNGNMLLVEDLWMLNAYLTRHGVPESGVVISHVWDIWGRNEQPLRANLSRIWEYRDRWDLSLAGGPLDHQDMVAGALFNVFPLFTQRASTREGIKNLLKRQSAQSYPLQDDGLMRVPDTVARDASGDIASHLANAERVEEADTILSDTNRDAFETLVSVVGSHPGLRVHLRGSAVHPDLYTNPAYQSACTRIEQELQALAAREDRIDVSHMCGFPVAPEHMTNADHVTESNIEALSAAFAESL